MNKMTMCTLTALASLALPAASAAASYPPDENGTAHRESHTAVVDHPCFRVPLSWTVADSGPLPTCKLALR
jgi:hypothetical protein